MIASSSENRAGRDEILGLIEQYNGYFFDSVGL